MEGTADSPLKLQSKAQRKFVRCRVQIVSSAAGKGEPSPERSAFLEEVQRTGVELPADMPTVHREPELPVIARRLLQAGERMQDELQKILAPPQSETPSQVRHGAMMLHVNRYRVRLEDALQRVMGFVDRLERLLPDGDDRILLYQTASKDVPGLRPALITREVADWHCEFVEREYGLMATEEEEEVTRRHRVELPQIHHATVEAFERFRAFLLHGV